MPDKSSFSWRPLGGLGEVGMNCMLLRFGEATLPVDCGVLFADTNNFGIEAIFPNFEKLLTENKIENWLITHAHEDHIGAIPHLFLIAKKMGVDPPHFWAPPFAHALICEKLNDYRYPGLSKFEPYIHSVALDQNIEVQGVQLRFIEVRHSTVDCCSIAFNAEVDGKPLRIFHSADIKIDFNEFEDGVRGLDIFDVFDGNRPDIMFLDSTNANREGQSVSEREIIEPLDRLIASSKQRVFVTLFSSNVYRMATLIHLAEKSGRKVALAGRSMQTAFRLARELGSFSKMPAFGDSTIVSAEVLASFPAEKQLILCSGSQGEFRSVLSRLGQETHPDFSIKQGDLVLFSSKMIPGNEKAISKSINSLMRIGAQVLWAEKAYEAAGGPIHASGHGRGAELRALLDYLKPKILFPVHGQRFQLEACAQMAKDSAKEWKKEKLSVHLQENNDEVVFENKETSWEVSNKVKGDLFEERFLRFDKFYCPSRDSFLSHRKKAALSGCVSVSISSSKMMKVAFRGIHPQYIGGEAPYYSLKDEIEKLLRAVLKKSKLSLGEPRVEEYLEDELGRYLKRVLRVRPVVFVHVND